MLIAISGATAQSTASTAYTRVLPGALASGSGFVCAVVWAGISIGVHLVSTGQNQIETVLVARRPVTFFSMFFEFRNGFEARYEIGRAKIMDKQPAW